MSTASQDSSSSLPLDDLAWHCARETELFFQGGVHNSQYCFELFRRALAGNDQQAWACIYAQYGPLVAGWVSSHPSIASCEGEIQEYMNLAFQRLWAAAHAAAFRFRDLSAVLAYLKMCVHSAIVDEVRRANQARAIHTCDLPWQTRQGDPAWESDASRADDVSSTDMSPERQYLAAATNAELWDAVRMRLHGDKELLVVHALFVLGLKPNAIFVQYPDRFHNVAEIYKIRQVVLERLRRDTSLAQFLAAGDT